MSAYRRLLVAVDLTEDSRIVARHASEIARAFGASVQLLHVVELLPVEPMNDSLVPVVQVGEQAISRARREIATLAAELGLPADATIVEVGSTTSEIVRQARERGSDLIVIGCRERHGLSLLIHRTEGSVLHGAPCDVLAVRVHDKSTPK
jgi:universal stress protein A